ncbi:hypothetical protein GFS24_25070 [Chitinophaga sp. SYP-B3965]|uniref:hypothetical protein n=1 Tax=Chitinophaga sp. SYP-B3965 TaxID=2663120 RepID=UPI001299D400|nr:hypothetical protein [Chitinophaga sp. SYP-B3965]MRG48411.1 hypothetical protein [Chitinophaga sp. SYP-B3965]
MQALMKQVYIFTLLLLYVQQAFSQQPAIDASYLAINLHADKTHKKQYWQPIHKMPAGNFKCRSVKNGGVEVSYDAKSKPVLYEKLDLSKEHDLAEIPVVINGFKLQGVYSDPNLPFDMARVFYMHPQKKNSVLILVRSLLSEEIFSVTYFSDVPVNPFEKTGLLHGPGKKKTIHLKQGAPVKATH